MSKIILILVLIVVGLLFWYYMREEWTTAGRGPVTMQPRAVKPFTKLHLDGVFSTIITQDGGPESVRVETNSDLQDKVEIANDGETLNITNKGKWSRSAKMVVYVNVKVLSYLSNETVGKVETQGTIQCQDLVWKSDAVGKTQLKIQADKFTANLNTVGACVIQGTAQYAEISFNSVGKLDASELKADVLHFNGNGVGAAHIYADKEIYINQNGVGKLTYAGPANVKEINNNGIGKITKE
jgi:Putative auto-transporter adhesin, head GIN domain